MNWDEFPISHEQAMVVGLVAALVVSATLAPMFLLPSSPTEGDAAQPTATPQEGQTYEYTEDSSSRPDEIGDLHEVPDSYTKLSTDSVPEPQVSASTGSQTMQIDVMTDQEGDPVLNLQDDRTHSGRFVAVDVAWFKQTMGYVPKMALIQHESGTTYSEQVRVRGDQAVFYVRAFSTNTVSFDDEIKITDSPASDGTQHVYDINDLDAASDPVLNLTGVERNETETPETTTTGGSGTLTTHIAGNLAPEGERPVVGSQHSTASEFNDAQTLTNLSVDSPTDSVRFAQINKTYNIVDDSGDGDAELSRASVGDLDTGTKFGTEWQMQPTVSGDVDSLTVDVGNTKGSDYGVLVDVYIVQERPDSTSGEGTLVKSDWDPDWQTGNQTIQLDQSYNVDSGTNYTVEFVPDSSDGDSTNDYISFGTDEDSGLTNWATDFEDTKQDWGGDITISISEAPGSAEYVSPIHNVSNSEQANINITEAKNISIEATVRTDSGTVLNQTTITSTGNHSLILADTSSSQIETVLNVTTTGSNAEIRVDDESILYTNQKAKPQLVVRAQRGDASNVTITWSDGTTTDLGSISSGQAEAINASVSTGDESVDVSYDGTGDVDLTLWATERVSSEDVDVEINGNWLNRSSQIQPSNTVSLTGNKSWLQSGSNRVNISVGDSLSSDAPPVVVDVVYQHDTKDKKSVSYEAEVFQESYNVSKTYASDRQNANLTIPHEGTVVKMRSLEYRINESGGWSTVGDANYHLNGTTLEVDLTGIYGGDIPAGTTMEVRSTGSKIKVNNGSITVTEVTTVGTTPLDSKIAVDSWASDSYVAVGDDALGNRLHYTAKEGWSSPDEFAKFDAKGNQHLHMPNAVEGKSTRVKTLPVKISPTSGEVLVEVPSDRVNRTEPVFEIRPGSNSGDGFDVTFVNAKDDKDYILYDESDGIVLDSGTASSPLTLSADSDDESVIQFELDDGSSSTSSDGGSGGGTGGAGIVAANTGNGNTLPLVALALVLAGLFVASRRETAIENAGDTAGDAAADATSRLPVIGAELGKAVDRGIGLAARGVNLVVTNRIAAGGIAAALLLGAVQAGLIVVPQGSGVIIIVAGVALVSLFVLRETGEFSMPIWVGINVGSTLLALEVLSDKGLIAAVGESRVAPLVYIGGLYLGYRLLKLIRKALERRGGGGGSGGDNTVTVQIEDGDSK